MSNRMVNVTNLSLDEYYEQHVSPMNRPRRAGFGPYPTPDQLVRHYHRTHFFGAAYPEERQRLLKERALVGGDNFAVHAEEQEEQLAKLSKLEERKRKFAKFDEEQKAKLKNSEKKPTTTRPKDAPAKEYPSCSHKERSAKVDTRSREMKRNDQRKPKSKEGAREKKTTSKEGKAKDIVNKAKEPEPLVLKIGDQILYDEAYKNDPLWMQHADCNYTC
ncbi:stress response protein NST1-like [Drosophila willistoni]|uniref:stress response protein NST1-like n=1 Tax=Drosophila willistoni TaxID=7260 RepID=UPI00017D9CF5|nr:stress response protein NST1-like [Drosophila willistoni]